MMEEFQKLNFLQYLRYTWKIFISEQVALISKQLIEVSVAFHCIFFFQKLNFLQYLRYTWKIFISEQVALISKQLIEVSVAFQLQCGLIQLGHAH